MRLLYITLLLAITLLTKAQEVRVSSPVRFLALGDSYTIGQGVAENERWPNILTKYLQNNNIEVEELNIIAQTGWRSDNLISAISREQPDSNYNLVSLLIGVNNQYQGTSIETYPNDFRILLNQAIVLCGGNKSGVLVLSIPDYGFTPFGEINKNQISSELKQYNTINKQITQELGVSYFDITPISQEALDNTAYLAPDNLHPSGKMYDEWVNLISKNLQLLTNYSIVEQKIKGNIEIYPNPASEKIVIESAINLKTVILYDLTGNKVIEYNNNATDRIEINVNSLSNGFYLLQTINKFNNKKIIKIRIWK